MVIPWLLIICAFQKHRLNFQFTYSCFLCKASPTPRPHADGSRFQGQGAPGELVKVLSAADTTTGWLERQDVVTFTMTLEPAHLPPYTLQSCSAIPATPLPSGYTENTESSF